MSPVCDSKRNISQYLIKQWYNFKLVSQCFGLDEIAERVLSNWRFLLLSRFLSRTFYLLYHFYERPLKWEQALDKIAAHIYLRVVPINWSNIVNCALLDPLWLPPCTAHELGLITSNHSALASMALPRLCHSCLLNQRWLKIKAPTLSLWTKTYLDGRRKYFIFLMLLQKNRGGK